MCEKRTFERTYCEHSRQVSTGPKPLQRDPTRCAEPNYSPLSTSAWLLRSKVPYLPGHLLERLATKRKKNSKTILKNILGVTSPRLPLCALSRANSFNVSVLRVEHALVRGYFRKAVEVNSQDFRTIPKRCRNEFVRMSTKSSGGGHRERDPTLKDSA
jgi:hypothetical protein